MISDSSLPDNITSSVWNILECSVPGNESCFNMNWLDSLKSLLWVIFKTYYLENSYFAGGVGLMIFGFLCNYASLYLRNLLQYFTWKRGNVCVYVSAEEPAFTWILEWLGDRVIKNFSQLTLKCRWEINNDLNMGRSSTASDRPKLVFIPQLVDPQPIYYKDKKITFQLNKGKGPANMNDMKYSTDTPTTIMKDELVVIGPDKDVLHEIIKEAMEHEYAKNNETKRTVVLRWSAQDHYWQEAAKKRIRPLESVVLDGDAGKLVKDAQQFFSSAKWYSDRGIPHRRGYLLYGPPGCGKTSLILALAGELDFDVSILSLSSKEMSDDMLHSALSLCRMHSIVVLEDVDSAFNQRMDSSEKFNSLSFSGLLNALDGISSQENQIIVMTTNHLDSLDPALIRPGRVDFRLYLGLASRKQAERLFLRFFPEETQEMAVEFASKLPENVASPASIQGLLLTYRTDSKAALENVCTILKSNDSELESPVLDVDVDLDLDSEAGL